MKKYIMCGVLTVSLLWAGTGFAVTDCTNPLNWTVFNNGFSGWKPGKQSTGGYQCQPKRSNYSCILNYNGEYVVAVNSYLKKTGSYPLTSCTVGQGGNCTTAQLQAACVQAYDKVPH